MRFAKFFLFTATACAFLAMGAVAKSKITCTYTAEIVLNVIHNQHSVGARNYLFNYTQASINNKMWTQEGFTPMGYPKLHSKDIYKNDAFTVTSPVFDHTACAILPLARSFGDNDDLCFYFPSTFTRKGSKIDCPEDSAHSGELCDRYEGIDRRDPDNPNVAVKWYVLTGTYTPVQWVRDGIDLEVYNFVSFDTKKPDPRVFDLPKDVICKDLTDDSAAAVNRNRHALVNDDVTIAKLNSIPKTWVAGHNKMFDGMTRAQAAQLLRSPLAVPKGNSLSINYDEYKPVARNYDAINKIPKSFDASKQWPQCDIDRVGDQASCGSCWAFGSTIALGDRYCIANKSDRALRLSPQYAVSCFTNLYGCSGGFTDMAWENLIEYGTVKENCFSYLGSDDNTCPDTCDDGSEIHLYKAKDAYPVYTYGDSKDTVEKIQKEIMTNGPVEAAFWVFEDFYYYSSGIYQHTPGYPFAGGHAVKIFGWGEENGTPYWLVANSWNTNWGENGLFKILRGSNECSIEDSIAAGHPLLE